MPPSTPPSAGPESQPHRNRAAAWLRILLPLLAGGLITLSFAPFELWPLGLAGAGLMAWVWQQGGARECARAGWLFGIGLFGSGASWIYVSIQVHGHAPVPLALLLTALFVMGLALFTALQGWLFGRFLRRDGLWLLLSFPGLWVLSEWFRSWFLTGFPWLLLGSAHLESPLAGWAPVTGVYGISFLVALTAAALLLLWQRPARPVMVIALLAGLLPWAAGALLRPIAWAHPAGDPLRVALVQANIPQELKWNPSEHMNILAAHRNLTQPYWGFDLVLWSETAIPMFPQQIEPVLELLDLEARTAGTALISGIPTAYPDSATGGYRFYNSIMAMGAGQGLYHKQKLVPFGEYVPLESVLRGLIAFFDLPMSSFSRGPDGQKPLQIGSLSAAPFICYEVVYPDFVARQSAANPLLLTISNDTWFGASLGPHQHLQIARMRALETARYLVRGTNNGISAIIDERGRIQARSGQFTKEVLTGTALPMRGTTPFAATGSMPILVLATATALLARDTRRRKAAQPQAEG